MSSSVNSEHQASREAHTSFAVNALKCFGARELLQMPRATGDAVMFSFMSLMSERKHSAARR